MVRCSTPGCLKKATWGTLKGTKVEVLFCPDHKGENKALVEATTIRKRLQRGDGVLPKTPTSRCPTCGKPATWGLVKDQVPGQSFRRLCCGEHKPPGFAPDDFVGYESWLAKRRRAQDHKQRFDEREDESGSDDDGEESSKAAAPASPGVSIASLSLVGSVHEPLMRSPSSATPYNKNLSKERDAMKYPSSTSFGPGPSHKTLPPHPRHADLGSSYSYSTPTTSPMHRRPDSSPTVLFSDLYDDGHAITNESDSKGRREKTKDKAVYGQGGASSYLSRGIQGAGAGEYSHGTPPPAPSRRSSSAHPPRPNQKENTGVSMNTEESASGSSGGRGGFGKYFETDDTDPSAPDMISRSSEAFNLKKRSREGEPQPLKHLRTPPRFDVDRGTIATRSSRGSVLSSSAGAIVQSTAQLASRPSSSHFAASNLGTVKAIFGRPDVPGDVSVGSLAVIRDHDNDVEIGCAVPLQVSSNLIADQGKSEVLFFGVSSLSLDQGLREETELCLMLLRRQPVMFARLVPNCQPKDLMAARRIIVEYTNPGSIPTAGASGGAALFVALYCTFTGAKIQQFLAIIGMVALGGKLMEVDLATLFLKLKAAYDVGLNVILPLRHKHHVLARLKQNKRGERWLASMHRQGEIQYADNVVELLHMSLEGGCDPCHIEYIQTIEEGISCALASTMAQEGTPFHLCWTEITAIVPGTGQLRALLDIHAGDLYTRLGRSYKLLLCLHSTMAQELQRQVVVDMRDLTRLINGRRTKVDLVAHCMAGDLHLAPDFSMLVSLLGVMFDKAPDPSAVFLGAVDGRGGITYDASTVRPVNTDDVTAMRRAGIRRFFIGQPMDQDDPRESLRQAAEEDLEPGVDILTIIVVPDCSTLIQDYVMDGPDGILSRPLGQPLVDEGMSIDFHDSEPAQSTQQEGIVEEEERSKEDKAPKAQGGSWPPSLFSVYCHPSQIQMLRTCLQEEAAPGNVQLAALAVASDRRLGESGCVYQLQVSSHSVEPREDEIIFSGVVTTDDDGFREEVELCLLIIRRQPVLFSKLVPGCSPHGLAGAKRIFFGLAPSASPAGGTSIGAACFVGLYCSLSGAKPKSLIALVGRVTLRGRLTEVDVPGLFLKLRAAYEVGLTVIIPRRHRHDVLTRLEEKRRGEEWLRDMAKDNIKYAETVLRMLELALEGSPRLDCHGYSVEDGISYALGATSSREGERFQECWVESTAITPGAGRLRALSDLSTGPFYSRLTRFVNLLGSLQPTMSQELQGQIVVDMRNRTMLTNRGAKVKVDLIVHFGAKYAEHGMDFATLVSLLGVMFQRAPSSDDVYIGLVGLGGRIYCGTPEIPSIATDDIFAMRREGVTRLFIGGPMTDEFPLERLQEAALENIGPDVAQLDIIIVPTLQMLLEIYVPQGRHTILPYDLGQPAVLQVEEEEECPSPSETGFEADLENSKHYYYQEEDGSTAIKGRRRGSTIDSDDEAEPDQMEASPMSNRNEADGNGRREEGHEIGSGGPLLVGLENEEERAEDGMEVAEDCPPNHLPSHEAQPVRLTLRHEIQAFKMQGMTSFFLETTGCRGYLRGRPEHELNEEQGADCEVTSYSAPVTKAAPRLDSMMSEGHDGGRATSRNCTDNLHRLLLDRADFRRFYETESMLQHDLVINLRFPQEDPQSKRARTSRSPTSSTTMATSTITAHGIILAIKSAFFKKLMDERRTEAGVTVEVELVSHRECEIFKALVKTLYGMWDSTVYTEDTLIELALMAQKYEAPECMESCLLELRKDLSTAKILRLLNGLVQIAPSHSAVDELLQEGIGSLGYLEDLISPESGYFNSPHEALTHVTCPNLQVMRLDALIYLLRSDNLLLLSENTTFTVAEMWIMCQDQMSMAEKEEAMTQIITSGVIRMINMDPTFITVYLTKSLFISQERGASLIDQTVQHRERMVAGVMTPPKDRANKIFIDGCREYDLNIDLYKAPLAALPLLQHQYRLVGLINGYPLFLSVLKSGQGNDTMYGLGTGWTGHGRSAHAGIATILKCETGGGITLKQSQATIIMEEGKRWEFTRVPDSCSAFGTSGNMPFPLKISVRLPGPPGSV